ncbi:hypothetical protein ACVIGB_006497 [Bradyrhizobium sp. USDA 4341]
MDDEFCKERARTLRAIAEQAEPFIRKRLLRLAANYERRVDEPESINRDDLTDLPALKSPVRPS